MDAYLHAQEFERSIIQQVANRGRGRAVAILQLGGNVGKLRFGFDAGDAFIHLQALVFFGDVARRNADVEAEVELGFGFVGRGFAFHFTHGTLEHLIVELESDGFDVAALFTAEHVAGAAEFEVESGDFKSRTEVGKFFERGEAATRDRRQFDVRRKHEIGVSAAIGTANAAPELVKLRESEAVGTVDQDRVAERNVEAVLDDRGRNQNVGFVVHEFQHHFFKFTFRHLPVADDDPGCGDENLELGRYFEDGVDAVVDEINLAAAFEFLLDGGLD